MNATPAHDRLALGQKIGGTVLRDHVVRYAEDTAGAFSSRTEAANIGTDVLSNFVLDVELSP